MEDTLIPLFAIFFIFGAPVVAFVVTRVLKHRERLEMIRHGMIPPGASGGRAYREWAQQQQAWSAPPQQPASWSNGEDDGSPERALHKGIRTAFIGFALLIGLSFIGGTPGSPDFHGGPWLLGGLIPMFVGVAQIIIAVLSGAQFPGVRPQVTYTPPPQPPPGAPQPPPGPSAPWQQQPGRPPFEELSKPVPPPDRR
ncbi:MAG TPA: DUF6249 domain-containing protein [Candidatus Limnocylindria bacterium]|jgi:hypothetical protein|nr:DUF6249 domain-containing protein [Candidatus Limnocylindria bacterium]